MFTLNCKGKLLTIDKPIIMGVFNVNTDSFYANSRFTSERQLLTAAEKMLQEGAAILDIGGQSTRPGSKRITAGEELERVLPMVALINDKFPEAIISIDTYHSLVAKEAVAAGAAIVNDISAGGIDPDLIDTVASLQVPYVLMHMQGRPENMQRQPQYENVTKEVLNFFIRKTEMLHRKGIKDIIIDPGFGFGKTHEHNFTLLKNLPVFKMLKCPLLLGVSRKGTIYKTLGTDAAHALNGTTVLNTVGLLNGAVILRVHDVREAAEAVRLMAHIID